MSAPQLHCKSTTEEIMERMMFIREQMKHFVKYLEENVSLRVWDL